LHPSQKRDQEAKATFVDKDMSKCQALDSMRQTRAQSRLRHDGSALLKQRTIPDSGGAGGLTSPTSKAKVHFIRHDLREREVTFGHTTQ
jgi:hypothetical protein